MRIIGLTRVTRISKPTIDVIITGTPSPGTIVRPRFMVIVLWRWSTTRIDSRRSYRCITFRVPAVTRMSTIIMIDTGDQFPPIPGTEQRRNPRSRRDA